MRVSAVAVLLGIGIEALGCGPAPPSVPPAIQEALVSREILNYRQDVLDGVPTLVLDYLTEATLLKDWSTITGEVARVWEVLRSEADRQQLRAARITVKTASDVATFDYRRSEGGGWEETRRDLVDVRAVPGGGRIGLRSVQQLQDGDGPWMSITYVTELDLAKQKNAVRDEANRVLSLYLDRAQTSGARKVLLFPSNRVHGGVSVGLLYVRDDATGKWDPRF